MSPSASGHRGRPLEHERPRERGSQDALDERHHRERPVVAVAEHGGADRRADDHAGLVRERQESEQRPAVGRRELRGVGEDARTTRGVGEGEQRGQASGNQRSTAKARSRSSTPIVAKAQRHPNAPPIALIAGTPAMAAKLNPTLNQPMARDRRWARQRSPSAASVLVGATEFTRPATNRMTTSVAKLGAMEAARASRPLPVSESTIIGRRPNRSASRPAKGELSAWGTAETTASTLACPSGRRRSRAMSKSRGPIIVIDVMMPMTIAVVSASVPLSTSRSSPGALTARGY